MGLFSKKDPICGMKETTGEGINKHKKWFCSKNCLEKYEQEHQKPSGECCGGH